MRHLGLSPFPPSYGDPADPFGPTTHSITPATLVRQAARRDDEGDASRARRRPRRASPAGSSTARRRRGPTAPQALEFLRRERNVPGIQPYLVQNLSLIHISEPTRRTP